MIYEDAEGSLDDKEISKTIVDHMIWNVLTAIIVRGKDSNIKNNKKIPTRPYIPIIWKSLSLNIDKDKYINLYGETYELLNILYQAFLYYTDPILDQIKKNTGSSNPHIGAAGLVFEGIKNLYDAMNTNYEKDHKHYAEIIEFINSLTIVLQTIKGYEIDSKIKSHINRIKTAKLELEPKCPFTSMIEKIRNGNYNQILVLYYPQIVHPIPNVFMSKDHVVPRRMQNIFDTLASLAKYLNRKLNNGEKLNIKHLVFLIRWKRIIANYYQDYDSYLRSSLNKAGVTNYEIFTEESEYKFNEYLRSKKTAIIQLYLQDYSKRLIFDHIREILESKEEIGALYSVLIPEYVFVVNKNAYKEKSGSGSRLLSLISLFEKSGSPLPKPLHKDLCHNIYVEEII